MKWLVVAVLVVLVSSKPLSYTSNHYGTNNESISEDSLTPTNMSVARNGHTQGRPLIFKSSPGSGSRIIKQSGNNPGARKETKHNNRRDLAEGKILTPEDEAGRIFHSGDSIVLQSLTSQVEGSRGNTELSSDEEKVLHGDELSEVMTSDTMISGGNAKDMLHGDVLLKDSEGNAEISSDEEEVLHGDVVSESMTLNMMYVEGTVVQESAVEGTVIEGTDIEKLLLEILLAN